MSDYYGCLRRYRLLLLVHVSLRILCDVPCRRRLTIRRVLCNIVQVHAGAGGAGAAAAGAATGAAAAPAAAGAGSGRDGDAPAAGAAAGTAPD